MAKKIETTVHTGCRRVLSEHANACSLACMAVSIFFGQGSKTNLTYISRFDFYIIILEKLRAFELQLQYLTLNFTYFSPVHKWSAIHTVPPSLTTGP